METEIVTELQKLQEWIFINQAGDKSIYIIGLLIFLSLIVVNIAKKYKVPIVVGYVFLGILLSVNIVEWIPFLTPAQKEWYSFTIESFDYITNLALGFIAFTIGSELSIKLFKKLGKSISIIVIFETTFAFLLVTLSIFLLGQPLYLALLLGGIASATAPAATVMVLKEYEAKGPLTSMIMAIVGIDDALALIIFSIIEPIAIMRYSGEASLTLINSLGKPLFEIFMSITLGFVLGYIGQYVITDQENKTKKILTLISTIIGALAIANLINASPLIANMTVGFTFRNFARKNLGIADYIDTITTPLYAMFFILAGTEIRFNHIFSVSFLTIALTYIIARIIGKTGGASLAAWLAKTPDKIRKYVGLGLFPQSGVAIALAYTVQKDFSSAPEIGLLIFNTLLFTAALTEVIGPLATKYAITKAGEAKNS